MYSGRLHALVANFAAHAQEFLRATGELAMGRAEAAAKALCKGVEELALLGNFPQAPCFHGLSCVTTSVHSLLFLPQMSVRPSMI